MSVTMPALRKAGGNKCSLWHQQKALIRGRNRFMEQVCAMIIGNNSWFDCLLHAKIMGRNLLSAPCWPIQASPLLSTLINLLLFSATCLSKNTWKDDEKAVNPSRKNPSASAACEVLPNLQKLLLNLWLDIMDSLDNAALTRCLS